MPRQTMSLSEAREIVRQALVEHGSEWDLRPLLDSLPQEKRALVARYFTELRKSKSIETTLSVDTETGAVSHVVRLPSGGDA